MFNFRRTRPEVNNILVNGLLGDLNIDDRRPRLFTLPWGHHGSPDYGKMGVSGSAVVNGGERIRLSLDCVEHGVDHLQGGGGGISVRVEGRAWGCSLREARRAVTSSSTSRACWTCGTKRAGRQIGFHRVRVLGRLDMLDAFLKEGLRPQRHHGHRADFYSRDIWPQGTDVNNTVVNLTLKSICAATFTHIFP